MACPLRGPPGAVSGISLIELELTMAKKGGHVSLGVADGLSLRYGGFKIQFWMTDDREA